MHDAELEQRLRTALRDQADQLTLQVDVEQLEALVVTRRRAARSSRVGLLAAAIGVVAFGIAAVGLNGGLPAGLFAGVAPATPVPCTPLVVTEPTSLEDEIQPPPQILLVDGGGTVHRGGLDSFRMPGSSTVVLQGLPAGESRLDPRTTSLEVTTAAATCLVAVVLELEPRGGGVTMTQGAESLEGPVASFSITAPPPGLWLATIRATFQTSSGATATSATLFLLVNNAPASPQPVAPTPSTTPLPAGLVAFEPGAGAEILDQVSPTWSGPGTRHVVQVPQSTTASTTIHAACVDEATTLGSDGSVTDPAHVTITIDSEVHEHPCLPDQPFGLTPPLTDQPTAIEISVPGDIAYTLLVESLPLPTSLPSIGMDGAPEVEGSSDTVVPDWSQPGGTIRQTLGTIDEGFSQEAVFTCLGPGTMSVEFRTPGSRPEDPPASASRSACVGEPDGLTIAIGATGPHEVVIEADVRTAWHVLARSDGDIAPFQVTCSQLPFDPALLEQDGNAEMGADPKATALREAISAVRSLPTRGWLLVAETATRAEYIAYTTSDELAYVALSNDGPKWAFINGGVGCIPRAVLEGMSRAEWLFDPDAPEPGPDATSVGVLVSELACTSGQGVGDRLRPPDIRYGDTTIVITFFAEPLPGGQDCQGSPPKPVTVNLREPIGTRAILDGSFYPPSDPRIPRP